MKNNQAQLSSKRCYEEESFSLARFERHVLDAKKAALQKQLQTLAAVNLTSSIEGPATNPTEARNSNFRFFYEHEGEESHLVPIMREYRLVDIQYNCAIKKNKFKPENIMMLSTSVRCTGEVVKSLKIGNIGLEIEAKEADCTTAGAKVLFHSGYFICMVAKRCCRSRVFETPGNLKLSSSAPKFIPLQSPND